MYCAASLHLYSSLTRQSRSLTTVAMWDGWPWMEQGSLRETICTGPDPKALSLPRNCSSAASAKFLRNSFSGHGMSALPDARGAAALDERELSWPGAQLSRQRQAIRVVPAAVAVVPAAGAVVAAAVALVEAATPVVIHCGE